MAQAKVVAAKKVEQTTTDEPTFSLKLPDGAVVVCGKPQGVMKLRLREILSSDQLKDQELVNIATAFLSIRSVGGQPVLLHSYNTFAALMDRFGSDELLDEFMNEYQQLVNPGMMSAIEEVLKEAAAENLNPDEIQDRITERIFKLEAEKRAKLRD
jgi:hypothetical protein